MDIAKLAREKKGGNMKRTLLYVLSVAAALMFAGMAFFVACSTTSSSSNNSTQAAEESASDVGSEELGDPLEVKTLDIAPEIKTAGKTSKLFSVSLLGQEQDNWCWAAGGTSYGYTFGGYYTDVTKN